MAMRFTEIPRDKFPPGSTPEEITKHYLDQSYTLDLMIAQHDEYVVNLNSKNHYNCYAIVNYSVEPPYN